MHPLIRLLSACALFSLLAPVGMSSAHAAAPPLGQGWLDRLVAELGSDEFRVRERANRSLRDAGAEAVPALRRGLAHADPEVRSRSLALAQRAEKHAIAYFKALGLAVRTREPSGWGCLYLFPEPGEDASRMTDEHMREVIGLPWLHSLSINNARVGDAGVRHLSLIPDLGRLDLSGTSVTDAGLAHLSGLRRLTSLRLSQTQVTGRGLAHLKNLKELRYLALTGCKVTDTGLAKGVVGIKGLPAPFDLDLAGTRVTDGGLACLKNVGGMRLLRLRGTRVTGRGLTLLKALPDLTEIDLSGTAVTDVECDHIAELAPLQSVDLDKTRVTAAGLRRLKDMPELRSLRAREAKVTAQEFQDLLSRFPLRVYITTSVGENRGKLREAEEGP